MKLARPLRIVHEDADLLVVDKPTGIATTSPDGRNCLVELVRALDPSAPKLHPTSRLDAEVSGIVTFARTSRGIEHCLAMRRAGSYERLYLALATCAPTPREGRWEGAIGVEPTDRRKRTVSTSPEALLSSTDFATSFESTHVVLLALHPRTGRTHQLRVHARHAGVPLLGDVHYGGERRITLADGRVVSAQRTMLHCARVEIPLPRGGIGRFVSLPHDDFVRTFVSLGGTRDVLTASVES